MKNALCAGLFLVLATLTGCSGGGSQSNNNTSNPTISSIQVAPSSMSIGTGASQQFTATAHMSDGTTKDVSSSVQWSSSDSNIASVTSSGKATASAPGTVNITAQSSSLTSTATLTVSGAAVNLSSIVISPAASSMPVNTSQQFTATGNYNDGSSADITALVTWSSSSTATATVSATGVVTAVAAGSTNISASLGGISQSTSLTVAAPSITSIAVTPVGLTLGIGINQQFVATATYSDGSSSDLSSGVTWSSSSTSVATINNSGLATTAAAGQTTITATVGALSDTSTLTVVAAHLTSISVTPGTPSIAAGTNQQFTAIGSFDDGSTQLLQPVSWSTSSSSVATVDVNGLATGVGTGAATITATSGSVSGTASLTVTAATLVSINVTPAGSSMAVGTTKQFTATGTFSDSSTEDITAAVVWTSSNPAAATINAQGLVSSVATGSTTITAGFGSITGSAGLTVSTAHLVSITITPVNPRISKGTLIKFTATGTFSDASVATNLSGVSWRSSKPNIASIRSSGIAHGKKGGTATISATASGITGTTTLTVGTGTLVSIAITPAAATATAGGTQQFIATGTFSDASTQDITLNTHWSSSSSSVATIANAPSVAGLANCIAAGTSNIGANSGGVTSSTLLTVQ
jgi:trimeric autotransporter adhesin